MDDMPGIAPGIACCPPPRPAVQSAHADPDTGRTSMKRNAAIIAATGLVLAGATALAMTPAHAATVGCRATYTLPNQWPSGFTANIAVTNLGDPISNWVITWDFAAGQQVSSGW